MSDRRRAGAYEAALDLGEVGTEATEILQEIDHAAALLGELLGRPGADRRRLVEEQPRFRALMLCDLLLDRSRDAGFTDPSAAIELAELAVVVTGRLDTEHYGEALVEDARARAWGHLANAFRIASDLHQAEEALRKAEEHHRQGGEDAYIGAEILSFKASLRNAQGRYEEAAALIDPSIKLYREARDRHREGKALIQKGTSLSYAGRHARAIQLVRQGLAKIDIYEEPRLLVFARHNLIGYLNEVGRHEEALRALAETRGLYLQLGERPSLIRLRWLEGKILRELGRTDEAEAAFREVRDELIGLGLGLDAALVSLELAMILLERSDTGELKRLAAEMIPVFESRDDHQKALAAFLLFQKAAETEQVTLGLLQEVASSLEQTRRAVERG
ncbi:MAG TPA: tetratricopeptide repeat protein [Thermoanaerobaculia bacterium]|nr:tetratricopeptide repeat protein [Thermoanaerobaculia bacterium]